MRQLTRTLLTLFAAVLALWLVVGFWPLSTVSRSVLSTCILLVCGAALWHRWRRRQFVIPVTEHVLPPEDFQGAVVLACGDTTSLFPPDTVYRETRQGWYIHAQNAEQLPLLAQHLAAVRPALVSQVSVLLALIPWYAHGGLSQNDALLAALFPRYGESALPLLRDAAAEHLAKQLQAFVQQPPDSPLRERMAKPVYDQLRLYLMLSRPEKMDAAWFSTTLMRDWPQRAGVANGLWQGSGPVLYAFYAASLASHPQWRLHADDMLVSQARTLLVRQMGVRNSESTLYQKMLAQVANQYADMRLEDMTGDTDAPRLFTTDEIVPGMFTRQAWEEAVQPAIDKVVNERREEMDWVLSDSRQPATQQTPAPSAVISCCWSISPSAKSLCSSILTGWKISRFRRVRRISISRWCSARYGRAIYR